MTVEPKVTPAPHPDQHNEQYVLDAVNNARVAAGKTALSKEECDKALAARPKPAEPPKVDPKEPGPPPPAPFVESNAQYLVGLPSGFVTPTLDDGRTKVTPPTPPRSNV